MNNVEVLVEDVDIFCRVKSWLNWNEFTESSVEERGGV